MDRRFEYLDKLYPIKGEGDDRYFDFSGTHSLHAITEEMDLTERELIDWIMSHFPDTKYSIKWGGGERIWYWGYERHRDDNKPAYINGPHKEYYLNGNRVDEKGEMWVYRTVLPKVNRRFS